MGRPFSVTKRLGTLVRSIAVFFGALLLTGCVAESVRTVSEVTGSVVSAVAGESASSPPSSQQQNKFVADAASRPDTATVYFTRTWSVTMMGDKPTLYLNRDAGIGKLTNDTYHKAPLWPGSYSMRLFSQYHMWNRGAVKVHKSDRGKIIVVNLEGYTFRGFEENPPDYPKIYRGQKALEILEGRTKGRAYSEQQMSAKLYRAKESAQFRRERQAEYRRAEAKKRSKKKQSSSSSKAAAQARRWAEFEQKQAQDMAAFQNQVNQINQNTARAFQEANRLKAERAAEQRRQRAEAERLAKQRARQAEQRRQSQAQRRAEEQQRARQAEARRKQAERQRLAANAIASNAPRIETRVTRTGNSYTPPPTPSLPRSKLTKGSLERSCPAGYELEIEPRCKSNMDDCEYMRCRRKDSSRTDLPRYKRPSGNNTDSGNGGTTAGNTGSNNPNPPNTDPSGTNNNDDDATDTNGPKDSADNKRNPGRDALKCLTVSTNDKQYGNIVFRNICNYDIFILWCGDLRGNKKNCGDGANGFYTGTANLAPNETKAISLDEGGSYRYAACEGRIGWSSSKVVKHDAGDNGRYTCIDRR